MTHDQRHQSLGIHGLHQHEAAHGIRRLAMLGKTRRLSWIAMGLLIAGLLVVMLMRWVHAQQLHNATQEAAVTHVTVVSPLEGRGSKTLELPGTLQGFEETAIYSRSSGYVRKWFKDIGDSVKAGEVLALIAAPEVEHELEQAVAAREQAATTLALARTSYERWKAMRQRDAVSQQDFDERQNAFRVAQASFDAADANAKRLENLVQYAKVVAPFSGVITKRNIDVGTLVDVGNGGSAKLLFSMTQSQMLRIYVALPQAYSQGVKVGNEAQIRADELPGQVFKAKVARVSGGLDAVTRTLQIEVDLPNTTGALMPGAYVTVSLQTQPSAKSGLTVPNNALLFRPEGVLVASVQDHQIHLKPVKLGNDLGTRIQVIEGLDVNDQIVINPPDGILEGQKVLEKAWVDPQMAAHAAQSSASGAHP